MEEVQQQSRQSKQTMWALGFGGFLVNADSRALAPMLPAIAAAFHTSASAAALLVTAYSIPYGLFQLVYGPLADRIGKLKTIFAALCLFALGTIACGLVQTYSWLIILRIVTGIFAAGIIPTALAQIGDLFHLKERPRAIAFFMSMVTSGQALGIVIGGIVAQFASYRILFFLLGCMAFPAIWALMRQRNEKGKEIPEAMPLRLRYQSLLRNKRAWVVYGLIFCEGFVFFAGFTFLGVYGVVTLHQSYLIIGLLTATYSLGALFGSRTITRVLNRFGASRMPVLGAFLMALGFAVVWNWEHVITLTLGFIILGFGLSYCHSTLQTYATDLLPQGRGTAMSVFAFSLFLGSGLGPLAGGAIYDRFGLSFMLGAVTSGMFVFSLLCYVFIREERKITETFERSQSV